MSVKDGKKEEIEYVLEIWLTMVKDPKGDGGFSVIINQRMSVRRRTISRNLCKTPNRYKGKNPNFILQINHVIYFSFSSITPLSLMSEGNMSPKKFLDISPGNEIENQAQFLSSVLPFNDNLQVRIRTNTKKEQCVSRAVLKKRGKS